MQQASIDNVLTMRPVQLIMGLDSWWCDIDSTKKSAGDSVNAEQTYICQIWICTLGRGRGGGGGVLPSLGGV